MELVLITTILFMYYITRRYNTKDWFKNMFVDALVQFFHIIILFLILIAIFMHNSVLDKLFLPLHIYVIIKNIRALYLNIFGDSSGNNSYNNDENKDDNYEDEW